MPSPKGENQVGNKNDQLESLQMITPCNALSPKVTKPEDVEGHSKKVMELTKGRISEWINDPDLLHQKVLRRTLLSARNTFFNS